MKPKGKLFALLAVFAAIGLVTATGAFTTVTAQRTAQVTTAGDSSALVAIQPAPTENGEEYAQINSGTLEINLAGNFGGDTGGSASGVNLEAATSARDVFNITNQGTQNVTVYITRADSSESNDQDSPSEASAVAFGVEDGDLSSDDGSNLLGNTDGTVARNITGSEANGVVLNPGESISVGLYIDTSDADPSDKLDKSANEGISKGEDLLDSITLHAVSGDDGDDEA